MKLSIVIICWNDWKLLEDCLRSIYSATEAAEFEVIVSDNGSTDGSLEKIRANFPAVQIVENGENLGFASGNNRGIAAANGEYILILNPDTIMHHGSLDRWLAFADLHPEAGAFGCRVLNPDGSYQRSARPFPTILRSLIAALGLRFIGRMKRPVLSDEYETWKGDSEREVDWQSGCCLMLRGELLKSLGGFDEQFFYHFEEVDLCRRVWNAGYTIRFTPEARITHLGGQSVGRFPIRFGIEKCRNGYRYFYKHFGNRGAWLYRAVLLIGFRLRQMCYGFLNLIQPSDALRGRLELYRAAVRWNQQLNPIQFVLYGTERLTESA